MKSVKCKNCAIYSNQWCTLIVDSPDPSLERDCQYFIQKTNYSNIKKMNIDKLAEFMTGSGWWSCDNCSEAHGMTGLSYEEWLEAECDRECILHCKEWLSKEVDDNED